MENTKDFSDFLCFHFISYLWMKIAIWPAFSKNMIDRKFEKNSRKLTSNLHFDNLFRVFSKVCQFLQQYF